jgi:hypothetical protein
VATAKAVWDNRGMRFLVRLRPFVRPWAIPIWAAFLWAWSVLAEVHLAAFVFDLGGDVNQFVHTHPGWVLSVSLLGLALLALWPEIKHLLPKLPRTIHERVHDLATDHEGLCARIKAVELWGLQIQELAISMGGVQEPVDDLVSSMQVLEKWKDERIEPSLANFHGRVSHLEAQYETVKENITSFRRDYKDDLSGLNTAIGICGDRWRDSENKIVQLREANKPDVSLTYVSALDRSALMLTTLRGVAYDIRLESSIFQGFQLISDKALTLLKENNPPAPVSIKMTAIGADMREFVHSSDCAISSFIDAIHAKVGPSFSLALTIRWTDTNAIRDEGAVYEATFQQHQEPRYALTLKQRLPSAMRLE